MSAEAPAGGGSSHGLSRPASLTLLSLAAAAVVGLVATIYGVVATEPGVPVPGPATVAAAGLVAACTGANLLLRFVRWQYLLRRLDVRVPTLDSLGGFVGSFAFLPLPLYVGQLVARTRLVTSVGTDARATLLVAAIWERVLDLWALAVLSLPALPPGPRLIVSIALLVAVVAPVRRWLLDLTLGIAAYGAGIVFEEASSLDRARAARAAETSPFALTLGLSLGAWLLTCASLAPLLWAGASALGLLPATSAAAGSIVVGASSLVPLGAGASGLFLLRELETLGTAPEAAALAVFAFRVCTVWLTLALGGASLLVHHRRRRAHVEADHFDHIDEHYDAWLPPHYRHHVVGKKVGAMDPWLARLGPAPRGLDIGCGRGWYLEEIERRGARMVGIDLSARQLVAAALAVDGAVPLARASALDLPFAAASFDFAYAINILHHLPTHARQVEALRDIAAVVRPGGLVFVHEMNVINPLFRFYLGYVFPILKGIEEGTEPYMDTRELGGTDELRLVAVDYFTFLPDFTPSALLPTLAGLERRLESSRLRRLGAHFLAVFERVPGPDRR